MSRLREDLCARIVERHNQWHRDAVDLYQMAELRPHQLRQDVFTVLMINLVRYCDQYDLKPEQVADALRTALVHLKEMEADE